MSKKELPIDNGITPAMARQGLKDLERAQQLQRQYRTTAMPESKLADGIEHATQVACNIANNSGGAC